MINDEGSYHFEIGKGHLIREGGDVTIVATGLCVAEALKACEVLSSKGINADLINIHTIKPIDEDIIIRSAKKTHLVVTAEEHSIIGGLGSAAAEVLSEKCPTRLVRVGIMDTYGESGPARELIKKYGIDSDSIVKAVLDNHE